MIASIITKYQIELSRYYAKEEKTNLGNVLLLHGTASMASLLMQLHDLRPHHFIGPSIHELTVVWSLGLW